MPPAQLPVLVGLADMTRLFPSTAHSTIYRWNTLREGRRLLPEPVVRVAGSTPLWTLEQVEAFAGERRLRIDAEALRELRVSQGHPPVA